MMLSITMKQFDKDINWNQFDFNDKSGLFVVSLSETLHSCQHR